jgi:hypothetical protein
VQRGLSCFQFGNGNGKTFRHLLVREACSDGLELFNLLVDLVALVAHLVQPALPTITAAVKVLSGEARTSHSRRFGLQPARLTLALASIAAKSVETFEPGRFDHQTLLRRICCKLPRVPP